MTNLCDFKRNNPPSFDMLKNIKQTKKHNKLYK